MDCWIVFTYTKWRETDLRGCCVHLEENKIVQQISKMLHVKNLFSSIADKKCLFLSQLIQKLLLDLQISSCPDFFCNLICLWDDTMSVRWNGAGKAPANEITERKQIPENKRSLSTLFSWSLGRDMFQYIGEPMWVNSLSSRCGLITEMDPFYMYLVSSVASRRSSKVECHMHVGFFFPFVTNL